MNLRMTYIIPLYSVNLVKMSNIFFIDVNECSDKNGRCHQLCDNTCGSYQCRCKVGFTLMSNKHSCEGKCSKS